MGGGSLTRGLGEDHLGFGGARREGSKKHEEGRKKKKAEHLKGVDWELQHKRTRNGP